MNYHKFNPHKINVVINCAALGDTICCLPIIYALLKEDRLHKILSNSKWTDLLPLAGIPAEKITFMRDDGIVEFDPGHYHTAPFYLDNRAPYNMHLVDFFSYSAAYAILDANQKSISIPRDRLPVNTIDDKNYIVMQASTRLRSRTILPDTWKQIKDYYIAYGLDVVCLGDRESDYDTTGCDISHLGCSIAESLSILWDARGCIGVDGGLIYLASLTNCPIVAGYSFVNPKFRLPYRHGEFGWKCRTVTPQNGCYFCSDSLVAYGIEFDVNCPNKLDFECIKSLRAVDFIAAMDDLLLD